jgi:hypothetical protein
VLPSRDTRSREVKETPRSATNSAPRRSTTRERVSSGTGRSERKMWRPARCGWKASPSSRSRRLGTPGGGNGGARLPQGKIARAREQSRGAVSSALRNYDFLYPIPPKTRAGYRKAFATRGSQGRRPAARAGANACRSPRAGQPDEGLTTAAAGGAPAPDRGRSDAPHPPLDGAAEDLLPPAREGVGDWRQAAAGLSLVGRAGRRCRRPGDRSCAASRTSSALP